MALPFQAEYVPEGSVWYKAGLPWGSNPAIRVEMPKGLMPPLWVYFCCTPAMYFVKYSTDTFSSNVNLQYHVFPQQASRLEQGAQKVLLSSALPQ